MTLIVIPLMICINWMLKLSTPSIIKREVLIKYLTKLILWSRIIKVVKVLISACCRSILHQYRLDHHHQPNEVKTDYRFPLHHIHFLPTKGPENIFKMTFSKTSDEKIYSGPINFRTPAWLHQEPCSRCAHFKHCFHFKLFRDQNLYSNLGWTKRNLAVEK